MLEVHALVIISSFSENNKKPSEGKKNKTIGLFQYLNSPFTKRIIEKRKNRKRREIIKVSKKFLKKIIKKNKKQWRKNKIKKCLKIGF